MIERQLNVMNKATSAADADEWPPSPEAGISRPAMPAKTVLPLAAGACSGHFYVVTTRVPLNLKLQV